MNPKLKKTIAREGLIFLGLFGISYIIYLVVRMSIWAKRVRKNKLSAAQNKGAV
jgi:hypothetical protein